MKATKGIIILVLAAIVSVFGYSYSRNPDIPVTGHAEAVGFVVANPLSGNAWRGLSCPHRIVVTELVTKALAPKLCGTENDGGAAARAARFKTEGPVTCWALYESLLQKSEARFSDIIARKSQPNPAAEDLCRRAAELIKTKG